jgi:hypothetical protein
MSASLLLSLLLLAAPGGPAPRARASTARPRAAAASARASAARLQVAEQRFNRGEFEAALEVLDAAARETRDERTLGRLHLLRAKCHAALRDTARSQEALASALEHDPEAALDPERVDPALVQQLEDLRGRTRGELRVRVNRPGVRVLVDGRPVGAAPLRTALPIGRHTVEARSADGRQRDVEQVLVRAGRTSEVSLTLAPEPPAAALQPEPAAAPVAAALQPAPAPAQPERPRPVADVRLALDPFQYREGPGIEVGGGLQTQHLRGMLHARLFQDFGLTLRGAAIVPVTERFNGYVSAELPVLFVNDTTALGLGGAAGAEYAVSQWLGLFGELGARHYFTGAYEANRLTLQGGARLRLP